MESSDLLCSDVCHGSSVVEDTLQQLEEDKDYYEQRYRQLIREKEESERKLERERRDRESLEYNYRQKLEERVRCEDKFTDVSSVMAKYEQEVSLLRSENSHLKTQFDHLKSVVNSRVSSTSAAVHGGVGGGVASGSHADHAVTGLVLNASGGSLPTVSHEMYREEISILSHENELFKQIIEIIERQDQVLDGESFTLNNREIQGFENSEQMIWMKTENTKLEERVRETERNAREQEMSMEQEREKAEEDIRKLKREVQSLKDQLEMGIQDLGDYENQIMEMKRQWDEEIQDMEVKLETEVSIKCQLQEDLHLLEMNIRALEEERKTLLSKIEKAYKKEDEIMSEREALEDTYSQEISEMQEKLDQEGHGKIEAFAVVEKLTNELLDVRNRQGEMEEMYMRELEEITLRFEAEKEGFMRNLQGRPNAVHAQTDSALGVNVVANQHVLSEVGVHAGADNWHTKLDQEVRKRQNLEEENKKILYQMNKILSGGDSVFGKDEGGDSEFDSRKNGASASRGRNERVRELEEELSELHEKCRLLERDARKKKEFENKIKELMEEIDDLMSKKTEMARKQKELMREAENSTSNVQEVEDKNRRLVVEIDNLSRKIRDIEDSCRREKQELGSTNKSSELNELRWENEQLKRSAVGLGRNNETLESKLGDMEQKLRGLQDIKERMEHENMNTVNRYTREVDVERSKTESLRQELEKASEGIKKQASEFERTLEDRKRLHEEHQKKHEDDKQRLKNELESEKESLRRCFEEERGAIEQRVYEIQTKLRQQGFGQQDTLLFASGTSGEVVQRDMVNQQCGYLPNQAASSLHHEVTASRTAREELDSKVRDTERKFQRQIEELMYKHDEEKRRLNDKMREDFRARLEEVKQEYEKQLAESRGRTDTEYFNTNQMSIERVDDSPEGARHTTVRYSVNGYDGGQHVQEQSLKNETRDFAAKFQHDNGDIIRRFEGEKQSLNVLIQSLKKDVCALKHEKDRAVRALNTERRNAQNRDSTNYENVARMKSEYEERIRTEREKTQKATTMLKRKITLSEDKVKEIEEEHRDEIQKLERKYEGQRIELESIIQQTEEQVSIRLQVEHEASLKDGREQYEETLRGLRREISALQEQRKQIQLKLKTTVMTSSNTSNREFRQYNKDIYNKLEYTARLSAEKQKLDDRVLDLEREVQVLKREKAEIKSSYRQEKAQMEAAFEKEKERLEERYREKLDERRRKLDGSQMTMTVIKDDKENLAQRNVMQRTNLLLETQRTEMEGEMKSMKDRLEDLEARQRHRAASQQRKRESGQHQRVRFSSPERESASRQTLYVDDTVTGRSFLKRHKSSADLRNDGYSSGSYIGNISLRSDPAGSSGLKRHSLSVNLPLGGETSGVFMNTGGSSFAGLGDTNFRPSSNSGMSGSSLRRHASSFELSSVGQSAGSLLNQVSSPTIMSSARSRMSSGRASQFASITRDASFLADGTHSMGYRAGASGMSFHRKLPRSGGTFPRNPSLFQEVSYLPSVGIVRGLDNGISRNWFGSHVPVGYSGGSNIVSRLGQNRTFSGSTGMLSGVGLHNGCAVNYPPMVSDARMTDVSVSVGETASADNAGIASLSSSQQIASTSSDISGHQATFSVSSEQQQQATAETSKWQVNADPATARGTAGQEEMTVADMTSGSGDDIIPDGVTIGISSDNQTS